MRAPDRRCVLRLPSDVADIVLGATRRYQTRYGSSDGLRPSGDHLLPGTHKPPGTILKQAGCWKGRHAHIPVFTSVCSTFTTGFGLPTDARCGPHRGCSQDRGQLAPSATQTCCTAPCATTATSTTETRTGGARGAPNHFLHLSRTGSLN